ncbi:organic solute transporter Ostalpha-domain-containing protein [Scheffersomyces xylosifermentans]|uniref:organic solute transporter Ostalpha-domain-containing protein n=1 Tax=Scheffersomyces xylosifermentans TaxID=1304137 RepID=UPI00315DB53E
MSEIPTPVPPRLPEWINTICFYSCLVSTFIIICSIILHLRNYRKPFQQRLMLRIQLIVPLFAISCYSMLVNQTSPFNKFVIEPIREVYEAFVIYTFFSLLTDMLGGERNMLIMTTGREPVCHPGIIGYFLPPLDISDPYTFLGIKRGILQYVWLKPIICFTTILAELFGWYDVNDMGAKSLYFWLTLLYNGSVTMSLYCLAIFWKILWNDLKPYNPVGKFLCVKLIIFASYWQGVILAILNAFHVLPGSEFDGQDGGSIGVCIQNGLLCVELIGFALGHWFSFSYSPFTISHIPYGRLRFKYALKDMVGIKDLIHDFRLTFYGDYYKDYKQFDSVEALIAHPTSKGRMSRINQGLRYHNDGKHKHWLPNQTAPTPQSTNFRSTSEIAAFPQSPPNNNSAFSIRSTNEYAASVNSTGTSMRAIYPISSPSSNSPPASPLITSTDVPEIISEVLQTDAFLSTINYDKEMLDEDELYYQRSCSLINNYTLDQDEVKKLLNYPIVDEMIDGHAYGYKVKRLRQERSNRQRSRDSEERIMNATNSIESSRYGSIV